MIITLFGAVGLIWGYIIQQFSQTVYILIAGVLLASIVSVPLIGIIYLGLKHLSLTADHSAVANLPPQALELAETPPGTSSDRRRNGNRIRQEEKEVIWKIRSYFLDKK